MNISALVGMHRAKHNPRKDTKPAFSGRTILVTGANTGVGFKTSVKFVQLGASRVILAVRSLKEGEDAKAQIEARSSREDVVEVWQVDMLDYDSIRAFAARVDKELYQMDIAVLNAGIVMATYQQPAYGWEKTLQVNVLSTALLSHPLLPKVRTGRTAEFTPVLELVSSELHYLVNDLPSEPLDHYNRSPPPDFFSPSQYDLSKLFLEYAHTGLTKLVDSKMIGGRPDVIVVSVCPDAARSDLARDHSAWYMRVEVAIFSAILQRTTEEGSRTYISGATLGEGAHGRFWQSDRYREEALICMVSDHSH